MSLRLVLLAVSLLGLAFASGCTTTSQGEARPATTGVTTSDSTPGTSGNGDELPYAGAPEVSDPLDTSSYEQDPCKALTASQTQPLNLPSAGETLENVALGNGCAWYNEETGGEVNIVFATGEQDGLSSEYKANEDGKWEVFEELPDIEGYPAVIRASSDRRDLGNCLVVVGTANDMVFESIVQLSDANVGKRDPCEVAEQVAGLALQTMQRGT